MPLLPTQGLVVVFEGPDLAGKGEQIKRLRNYIRTSGNVSKYLPFIDDREPTFRADEIVEHLKNDTDAFSDAQLMAQAYIKDRIAHTQMVKPLLESGYHWLEDRYRMSTDAFQTAQGMDVDEVLAMQETPEIVTADMTFVLSVTYENQCRRRDMRAQQMGQVRDKFDDAPEAFMRNLLGQYDFFAQLGQQNPELYGKVVVLDGNRPPEQIATDVQKAYQELYDQWVAGDYTPNWSGLEKKIES